MRRKSRKALDSENTPLAGSEGPNPGTLSAEWTTSLGDGGGGEGWGVGGGEVIRQEIIQVDL